MSKLGNTFDRVAGVVGDFDSPFYAEERQRDVWNEASALGLQAMLWGTSGLACAMAWIGGRPLAGWALALLLLTSSAAWLTILYANRHGVSGQEDVRWNRPRLYVYGALGVATLLGLAVRSSVDVAPSTIAGGVLGLAFSVVGIRAGARRAHGGTTSGEDSFSPEARTRAASRCGRTTAGVDRRS